MSTTNKRPLYRHWYAVRLPTEPFGISTVRRLNTSTDTEFYRDGFAIVNAETVLGALCWARFEAIEADDWNDDGEYVRIQPAPALPIPVSNAQQVAP